MFKFVFAKLRHTIKNWTDREKKLLVKLVQLGIYRHNRIVPVKPCVPHFTHRRSFIVYIRNIIMWLFCCSPSNSQQQKQIIN